MGDGRPGERAEDPNGLVVRRGGTSIEAHGRTVVIILCTILILGAIVWTARDVDRRITEHEKMYNAGVEAARAMIEQLSRDRRAEHQALDRRLDILSCSAMLTDPEKTWVRGQRNVTWNDRCPWITPEPK